MEQPAEGPGGSDGLLNWDERCYLLSALGGFLGEVVVGVVGLGDAAEEHGHHACRWQRDQGQLRKRLAFRPSQGVASVCQNVVVALSLFMSSAVSSHQVRLTEQIITSKGDLGNLRLN